MSEPRLWCLICKHARDSRPAHAASCSNATLADLRVRIATNETCIVGQWRRLDDVNLENTRLQGKCAVLRHENNRLRAKVQGRTT